MKTAESEKDTDARALARCWNDLSDLGNAKRLLDHAQGRLKYLPDEKAWIAFDAVKWTSHESLEGERIAREYTQSVAEGVKREARALAAVPDGQLSEVFGAWCTSEIAKARKIALFNWATDSGNSSRASGMLAQAKGMAAFAARLMILTPMCTLITV